ncbi:MAG: Cysteinyl-tRNA synthetase (EC [uncultured Campylobacterales bacterium]|uniref:Cysteine--tRNA ligase n=1 Tax=uncultured Campylobacterales bacterium TaxID=352960 RepID=A0A6S6T6K7_9BACT|nr:MAG: Cysteinyl-tRNA synthetase (EC [uncultured Campylobacterales bacterium]
MYIYDSVKKQKIEFIPQDPNNVKVYICGPTVYDDAHLGHARSAISFDLLHRVLLHNKYKVTFVQNITDIDDKIINRSIKENKSLENITDTYTNKYIQELRALNVLDPDIRPKATNSIQSMQNLIDILFSKDIAYVLDDGIYFDISKDDKYNSISKQVSNDTEQRVFSNKNKRNSADFALWKFQDKSSVGYEYKLGYGRPGWHVECSAMIEEHLDGESEYMIDIHGGGQDLLFPHHENEAAQTRCSSNKELSKYWMHNGFVNIDGEKMSKSLGNSFFIKDTFSKYHPEALRFYLLSTHYRSILNFSWENLEKSKVTLDKLYRLKKRIFGTNKSIKDNDFEKNLLNTLNDDLNISEALSVINQMLSSYNDELDKNPKDKTLKFKINNNLSLISTMLGIGGLNPYEYFQFGLSTDEIKKINELIELRLKAKKDKNFAKSDEIRDKLTAMNISIMDTPETTYWEKI